MDKPDMFQPRYEKNDKFGWWDLERISAYSGLKFTLSELKKDFQTSGVHLTLGAP